ncbi:conserved domain protein, partial [delta proteobacterium NaphS2]
MVRRGSEMPFLRLMGCYCERFSPPRLRQSSTNCSGGVHMMVKKPLFPKRIRKIAGGFAFIEHRFLRKGFWESLSHIELLLYIFLVVVSDKNGLSYYGYDKICRILRVDADQYINARNRLLDKDLIGFDGRVFQVLSLPDRPVIVKPVKEVRNGGWFSLEV